MDSKTITDINIDQLTISECRGDKTIKTVDVKEINEPLFIIQVSADYNDMDILKKSLYQLMKITKYKTVLIFHEYEDHLETLTAKLKSKFSDKVFLFAIKRGKSLDSHYKINFMSLAGVTLHYEVDVVIDPESGTNEYTDDPNNPINKPWTVPPTSASPTISKWSLPLPEDMSDARDPLVSRAIYIRSFMERSRGDIKQWSWVWEKEIQNIEFVASKHMEERYEAKRSELMDASFQIVFHGTDERENVDSILQTGFDKSRVKRVRRGFSPAWTSSSFDKAFSFARKPGAILMNRLLLGNTWQDNSRADILPPFDTKLCTADSMFPSGHAGLPSPHYLQLGPRHEDQVLTFAVITFHVDEDEPAEYARKYSLVEDEH